MSLGIVIKGPEGLVLAAETAVGKYPVEAVKIMKRIIGEYDKYHALSRNKMKKSKIVDWLAEPCID